MPLFVRNSARALADYPKSSPDIIIRTDGQVADTDAAQNGSWRKMAEAEGSRRKLTEAGKWLKHH